MSSFKELDLSSIKGVSVTGRTSKVKSSLVGRPVEPDATLEQFLDSMPDVLGAAGLRGLAARVASARKEENHVVWMIGGHVIKCGVGPHLVDLLDRRLITAVGMNGAAAIHDFEMAMWGHTSEDVEDALERGEFGMTEETARLMNQAVTEGTAHGWGFGEALGRALEREDPKHPGGSVLLNAWKHKVPATIHVAIGTDVIHQHPSLDPAALGSATYTDFKVFVPSDGESFALTGHHEILIPLLASAIKLEARRGATGA
jgi:deoxyhypusine synthase